MKVFALLAVTLCASGCDDGDGPVWARAQDEAEADGADDAGGGQRGPDGAPGEDAPPAPRPPGDEALPTDEDGARFGGEVRLGEVWSDGLDVTVGEIGWAARGDLRVRLSVVDSLTREPVAGLGPESFEFAENGVGLGAEALFSVTRAKDLRVVLVLDLSYSVAETGALEDVRRAARTLVEQLPREARVAVVGFATEYTLLADFSTDAAEVAALLEDITPQEGRAGRFTNLWGAVRFGARQLARAGGDGGNALVLFTDGRDNVADATPSEAAAALADARATPYAVGLGEDLDEASLARLVGANRLLTTTEPAALTPLFREVAGRLGEHLTVVYSTPKRRGTHTLGVTVSQGDRAAGLMATFSLE